MKQSLLASTALLLTVAASAQAGHIVYENFSDDPLSDGYPYLAPAYGFEVQWIDSHTWFNGDGSTSVLPFGTRYAVPFTNTSAQDVLLSRLSLAVYKYPAPGAHYGDVLSADVDNLSVLLFDNMNGSPGELIETVAVDPDVPQNSTTFLDLASPGSPVLAAGETYWVVLQPTRLNTEDDSDNAVYYWMESKTEFAPYNRVSYHSDLLGWLPFNQSLQSFDYGLPTLRVEAMSVVPEPGTALALASGALVLMRRRRAM